MHVCMYVLMYICMYMCAYIMYVHPHIMDKMKNLLFKKKETLYTFQFL